MRVKATAIAHVTTAALMAFGSLACRQDMHDQPKYSALEAAPFFADNSSARPPLPGTVARGELRDDQVLYTGKVNDEDVTAFPFPITEAVVARGRERFDIYCSPCHGRTGAGDGIVVQRGYTPPPPLDAPHLREAPPGHFFDVITNGFGSMPDYAAQIKVTDRWAIAAYVRALQAASSATPKDVPPAERGRLEGQR